MTASTSARREQLRRLVVIRTVHGSPTAVAEVQDWPYRFAHCQCSRCMLPSPTSVEIVVP